MVCSVVAHKSEGTQVSIVASKMSDIPEDEVSSHAAGKMKPKSSHKDNY